MSQQSSAQDMNLALNGGVPLLREPLNYGKGLALIDEVEVEAVSRALRSRALSRYGSDRSMVTAFEQKLAVWTGRRYALACATGTAAMRLALAALGVRPGDEILLPALLPSATADAVMAHGALPVFVDVRSDLTLDVDDAERKITFETRGIVGVHPFGIACDMVRLTALAHQCKLLIIEEAAGALGATYAGRKLGSHGFASTFSFEPEQAITAGEGGAVVFGDPVPYERAVRYHDHGGVGSALHGPRQMIGTRPAFWGENLRMSELQGAVLNAQIDKLPSVVEGIAQVRRELLGELRRAGVETLCDSPRGEFATSVLFRTRHRAARDLCLRGLLAEGIPAHLLCDGRTAYEADHALKGRTACPRGPGDRVTPRYERGTCPLAEELASVSVGVHLGPRYTSSDVNAIAKGIRRVLAYADAQSTGARHDS
jgi:dTDP-4-amino-4,6-dideoxygalactose transaminase